MDIYGYKKNKCKEKINVSTYSTTEQKIGTWIDGQPLYRKVFETTAPTTTDDGTYQMATGAILGSDIDIAIIEFAYLIDSSNTFVPIPYSTNSGHQIKANLGYASGNRNLAIYNGIKTYNNSPIIASVLYTKTTD